MTEYDYIIRNDKVEELRAEGSSVARLKIVYVIYVGRTKVNSKISWPWYAVFYHAFDSVLDSPCKIFLSLFPYLFFCP